MLASSGYLAVVAQEACTGCGICVNVCQFGALKLNQGASQVDEAVCMGCGVCVNHCPQSGIELRREESQGIPFEIFELMKLQQD
ncbi:MAG: 4Fe-4S binding protein [Anaerolineaceae bacterium]